MNQRPGLNVNQDRGLVATSELSVAALLSGRLGRLPGLGFDLETELAQLFRFRSLDSHLRDQDVPGHLPDCTSAPTS
jgi:hypothetical protein